MLSCSVECRLALLKPNFISPFQKTKQEFAQWIVAPETSSLQEDLAWFLQSFVVCPLGSLDSLGERCWCTWKGWISYVEGREKDGHEEGSPFKWASEGTRNLLSLKEMFSPQPSSFRAVMQQNSLLSNHCRRFLEDKNGKKKSACKFQ